MNADDNRSYKEIKELHTFNDHASILTGEPGQPITRQMYLFKKINTEMIGTGRPAVYHVNNDHSPQPNHWSSLSLSSYTFLIGSPHVNNDQAV